MINDASYDYTLEVMEDFQLRDSRIVVVNVQSNERFWGNKKYALTLGIKKAKYEKLVFTDADCYPASENWLAEMANGFQPEKSIGSKKYIVPKKYILFWDFRKVGWVMTRNTFVVWTTLTTGFDIAGEARERILIRRQAFKTVI